MTDNPHRLLAERMLGQWGLEMARGQGAPNILAIKESRGGVSDVHISPGPQFSPAAARADLILKDMRKFDEYATSLLMANAIGFSRKRIAANRGVSESKVQIDLADAFGVFLGILFARSRLSKEWRPPPRRGRPMEPGDIGFD